MANYPEHEKQAKVKEQAQTIGEFLEWLASQDIQLHERPTKEAVIARMKGLPVDNDHCPECGKRTEKYCSQCRVGIVNDYWDTYFPVRKTIEQILARYFEIDLNQIEEENRQLLDKIRSKSN